MNRLQIFGRWLATPFRKVGQALVALVNMTGRQMRSLFSLAMIGGMVSLSAQNVWYTFRAEKAVGKGQEYHSFFALLQEQLRFNSGLIAWFAIIMGGLVWGADYFRAKWGDKEVGMGKGAAPPEAAPGAAAAPPPAVQP